VFFLHVFIYTYRHDRICPYQILEKNTLNAANL